MENALKQLFVEHTKLQIDWRRRGLSTSSEDKAFLDRLEKSIVSFEKPPLNRLPYHEQCLKLYLLSLLLKNSSSFTIKSYQKAITGFHNWLLKDRSKIAYASLDLPVIREYLATIHARGAFSQMKLTATILRSYWKFLIRWEYISGPNVMQGIAIRKAPQKIPRGMSKEDVVRMILAIVSPEPKQLRDMAILETLYSTGMRVHELCNLKIGDVDFDKEMVHIRGKGMKYRWTAISTNALVPIKLLFEASGIDYTKQAYQSRPLFATESNTKLSTRGIHYLVRGYGEKAGLKVHIHPHMFRHSCATHMLENGADIRYIGEQLGHSSVSTTAKYCHVNLKLMQGNYDKAHPRA